MTNKFLNDVFEVTAIAEEYNHDYYSSRVVSDEEKEFLNAYGKSKYAKNQENPTHTADILVFTRSKEDKLQIALIERLNYPYRGFWCLPGGFVDENEQPVVAAKRELMEETNTVVDNLTFVKTYTQPFRDPRLMYVYSHAFFTLLDEEPEMTAGDDAKAVKFYNVEDVLLDRIQLGFDHKLIIVDAIQKLQKTL